MNLRTYVTESSDSLECIDYCYTKLLPAFEAMSGHAAPTYYVIHVFKTTIFHESTYHTTFGLRKQTTSNYIKGLVLSITQYVGN